MKTLSKKWINNKLPRMSCRIYRIDSIAVTSIAIDNSNSMVRLIVAANKMTMIKDYKDC